MMISIIKQLRATSSKNEKEAILKQHTNNELFRKLLEQTYSPLIKFGVKTLPEASSQVDTIMTLEMALSGLALLSSRQLTGHAAVNHVAYLLGHLTDDDADVLRLVLGKSLRIGCEVSTINKAMGKNFIKETPYSGAVSFDQKKVANLFKKYDSIFSQTKMDGRFSNVVVDDDSIFMESRQGLPTYFGDAFDFLCGLNAHFSNSDEKSDNAEPVVLNGELIIDGYDRYTANGIISSLVSIGDKIQDGQDVTKEKLKLEKEFGASYEDLVNQVKIV